VAAFDERRFFFVYLAAFGVARKENKLNHEFVQAQRAAYRRWNTTHLVPKPTQGPSTGPKPPAHRRDPAMPVGSPKPISSVLPNGPRKPMKSAAPPAIAAGAKKRPVPAPYRPLPMRQHGPPTDEMSRLSVGEKNEEVRVAPVRRLGSIEEDMDLDEEPQGSKRKRDAEKEDGDEEYEDDELESSDDDDEAGRKAKRRSTREGDGRRKRKWEAEKEYDWEEDDGVELEGGKEERRPKRQAKRQADEGRKKRKPIGNGTFRDPPCGRCRRINCPCEIQAGRYACCECHRLKVKCEQDQGDEVGRRRKNAQFNPKAAESGRRERREQTSEGEEDTDIDVMSVPTKKTAPTKRSAPTKKRREQTSEGEEDTDSDVMSVPTKKTAPTKRSVPTKKLVPTKRPVPMTPVPVPVNPKGKAKGRKFIYSVLDNVLNTLIATAVDFANWDAEAQAQDVAKAGTGADADKRHIQESEERVAHVGRALLEKDALNFANWDTEANWDRVAHAPDVATSGTGGNADRRRIQELEERLAQVERSLRKRDTLETRLAAVEEKMGWTHRSLCWMEERHEVVDTRLQDCEEDWKKQDIRLMGIEDFLGMPHGPAQGIWLYDGQDKSHVVRIHYSAEREERTQQLMDTHPMGDVQQQHRAEMAAQNEEVAMRWTETPSPTTYRTNRSMSVPRPSGSASVLRPNGSASGPAHHYVSTTTSGEGDLIHTTPSIPQLKILPPTPQSLEVIPPTQPKEATLSSASTPLHGTQPPCHQSSRQETPPPTQKPSMPPPPPWRQGTPPSDALLAPPGASEGNRKASGRARSRTPSPAPTRRSPRLQSPAPAAMSEEQSGGSMGVDK